MNVLLPKDPSEASKITEIQQVKRHIIFVTETYNFLQVRFGWGLVESTTTLYRQAEPPRGLQIFDMRMDFPDPVQSGG